MNTFLSPLDIVIIIATIVIVVFMSIWFNNHIKEKRLRFEELYQEILDSLDTLEATEENMKIEKELIKDIGKLALDRHSLAMTTSLHLFFRAKYGHLYEKRK